MNRTLLILAVALVGCTTATTSNEVHSTDGTNYEYNAPNSTLAQVAEVVSITPTTAEDGSSFKIVFILRNNTMRQQYAKYTITWLDEAGAPVPGAVEVSRQVTLPTGRTSFSAVATSPRAKKFKLLISETQ